MQGLCHIECFFQQVEGWESRLRRRAMSCSFSRRPSMSVVSLLTGNRPASVIETSHPNALDCTIAFPSTSDHLTSPSVFNVNYQSVSSPPCCTPMYSFTYEHQEKGENVLEKERMFSKGLCENVFLALETTKTFSPITIRKGKNNALAENVGNLDICQLNDEKRHFFKDTDLTTRDQLNSHFVHAEFSVNNHSKLKYKSRTMNCLYDTNLYPVWQQYGMQPSKKGMNRRSQSCSIISDYQACEKYEVDVESLSTISANLQRLRLENVLADLPEKCAAVCSIESCSRLAHDKITLDNHKIPSPVPLREISCNNKFPSIIPTFPLD